MKYGITLNKIVDDILNDKGGGISDDNYAREQIIFKVLRWRDLFIRRDIDRNGVNNIYQQTIPCLPLEYTNQTLCCGGESQCKILRSISPIPQFVRLKKGFGYIVTSTTDDSVFPAMRHTEARRLKYSRFTANFKRAYIKPDNHLYILEEDLTRFVNFTGIFFDPREAARFINCSGGPCYTDDDPFPLSGDLIDAIYAEIMKELNPVNQYDAIKEKTEKLETDEVESN